MHLTKCVIGAPISVAELATLNILPPKFPTTLVFKKTKARRSPMHFRIVGGQDSHVHGALLIGSNVGCE